MRLTLEVYEEGPYWVVRCLEHDLVAQGSDIGSALDNFRWVLVATLDNEREAGHQDLNRIPAPQISDNNLPRESTTK